MDLNTIELPGFIVAGLYKDSLVSGTEKKVIAASAPAGYRFLGDNRKKITLIVDSPGDVFLPDRHLSFITKILEACKVNIGDVAIVNHASTPVIVVGIKKTIATGNPYSFWNGANSHKVAGQFPAI